HLPGVTDFPRLSKHLVSLSDSLSVLPGTINVVDGERIKSSEFVNLLKICRKYFDYIVIDTESRIEDIFLNALDVSDRILFLVDPTDIFTIKCASRYFAGIRKLNYADERMAIVATKVDESFVPDQLEKMLKLPVFGALPKMAGYTPEYGVTPFQKLPNSSYVQFVRKVSTVLLNEASAGTKTPSGFLSRLFFGSTANSEKGVAKAEESETCGLDFPNITPENLRVLMKYVRVTYLNGKFEEARRQTQHILTYCPKSALVYQVLGEIFQAEGSISDAIECYRKAMDLDPQNHYATGQLGILGNDEKLFNRAVQLVNTKIQEHPRYPDLHKDLGVLYLNRRMIDPAIAAFKKALEVNPNYGEARVHMADALGHLGRYPEAIDSLSAVKQKTIRVYYLLGNYLHTLGRFHEAIDAYRMVLKINPSYEDTARRLDKLESYFEKVQSLIEMHEDIIRTRPSFPDIHMKLGMMYAVVGRRSEAEKAFRKALELNPQYEDARRYLDQL
ncbi:MAG TPA: tetratricopeptide repeat protein, partial [Candidatus Ozemobacteraceae bacterium]|nr:tetratricopeptide repeat protein [Candidatus Ozemobacteraceae bacterium]